MAGASSRRHRRRRGGRPRCSSDGRDPVADLRDAGPGPDYWAEINELRRRLCEAVGRLRPGDQDLLAAWNDDDRSSEELGAERGVSAEAIRIRVHRLVCKLRDAVLETPPRGGRGRALY